MTPVIFPVSLSLHGGTVRRRGVVTAITAAPVAAPCTKEKFKSGDTLYVGLLPAASDHVMVIGVVEKNNVERKRSKVQGVRGTSN